MQNTVTFILIFEALEAFILFVSPYHKNLAVFVSIPQETYEYFVIINWHISVTYMLLRRESFFCHI